MKKPKKTKYSKGWETRRKNAKKLGVSPHAFAINTTGDDRPPAMSPRAQAIQAVKSAIGHGPAGAQALDMRNVAANTSGESPGHGEIVGGADAKLADELVKLARSKGGTDKVQAKLRIIQAQARYEGESAQDTAHTKRLVDIQRKMADAVVCGFIAEIEMAQRLYGGLPKDLVWSMSSFTAIRIVDALNAAGYTSKGRKEPQPSADVLRQIIAERERPMGKRHGSTG